MDYSVYAAFFEPVKSYYSEYSLQKLWYQRLWKNAWKTVDGRSVKILTPGNWNENEGPDFTDCRLFIGDILHNGHIEIHFDNADWYRHNHHQDPRYNDTVLHIVFRDVNLSVSVQTRSAKDIPVLYIPISELDNLELSDPCRRSTLSQETFFSVLYDYGWKRLEQRIAYFVKNSHRFSLDLMLLWGIFKTSGIRYNQSGMIQLFLKMPWDDYFQNKIPAETIESLLFELAGIQAEENSETDIKWVYARTRPVNFPDRRLAWIAAFLRRGLKGYGIDEIRAQIKHGHSWKNIREQFFNVELTPYWLDHFRCGHPSSSVHLPGKAGQSFQVELSGNIIFPLLLAAEYRGNNDPSLIRFIRNETDALKVRGLYAHSQRFLHLHNADKNSPSTQNWIINQGILAIRQLYCLQEVPELCPICSRNPSE